MLHLGEVAQISERDKLKRNPATSAARRSSNFAQSTLRARTVNDTLQKVRIDDRWDTGELEDLYPFYKLNKRRGNQRLIASAV